MVAGILRGDPSLIKIKELVCGRRGAGACVTDHLESPRTARLFHRKLVKSPSLPSWRCRTAWRRGLWGTGAPLRGLLAPRGHRSMPPATPRARQTHDHLPLAAPSERSIDSRPLFLALWAADHRPKGGSYSGRAVAQLNQVLRGVLFPLPCPLPCPFLSTKIEQLHRQLSHLSSHRWSSSGWRAL